MPRTQGRRRVFHFVMVKPSHYDDDGYVIQFLRSAMPSNTLATLWGIAADCAARQALGDDVELRLTAIDETNTRVRINAIARRIRDGGGLGLIGLVGVQSNQFPRALDLARQFRARGLQVCIGGFHVSGVLAMLGEPTPELREAIGLGVSLFAGEAEGRLDVVLRDALAGELKPLYSYIDDLPSLQGAPRPLLEARRVKRTAGAQASFDAGRGCPFHCSFCTIINVQGRTSRFRDADDIESLVRANLAHGIRRFFITDDDFARNRNWEAIFDRLIEMREREKLRINLVLQVDTACHTIPRFIEKAGRAGVKRVFIGLENINPDSLTAARKGQNRITEYRRMLHAWRAVRVVTVAGYILGFPTDTPESIARDIEIIKRELPIDALEFFFLTPLPGSADHLDLVRRGVALDADLNHYDLNHATTAHPRMSTADWRRAHRLAWDAFFTPEHVETLLRRARVHGLSVGKIAGTALAFYGSVLYEGVQPLESGILRFKFRKDRRPSLPIESPWVFYPRYAGNLIWKCWSVARLALRYARIRRRVELDPKAAEYTDVAISQAEGAAGFEGLELYTVTPSARLAASRARSRQRRAGSPMLHSARSDMPHPTDEGAGR